MSRSIWRPAFVEYMDDLIQVTAPVTEIWTWFSTQGDAREEADTQA